MKKFECKSFINKNKNKIIGVIAILAILILAFWYGGDASGSHGFGIGGNKGSSEITQVNQQTDDTNGKKNNDSATLNQSYNNGDDSSSDSATQSQAGSGDVNASTERDGADQDGQGKLSGQPEQTEQNLNDSFNSSGQQSAEMADSNSESNAGSDSGSNSNSGADQNSARQATCTISISCATIQNNMEKLKDNKKDLIPGDGWILRPIVVELNSNESAFDVLNRVCQQNRIHMESTWTPIYNSAYVEGIGNLYEFDCGSLSGWMYNVNGTFYNTGASGVTLSDGDVIRWVYTCDLGNDVK